MRLRNLALGLTAVGLLAVGTAAPSPAAEVKKFEGTIALPAPVVSSELAQDYVSGGKLAQACPEPGAPDGVFYKFFDLKADYKFFWASGPPLVVDVADPTGVLGGSIQDYDIDLLAWDSKCKVIDIEGAINLGNGVGAGTAAKPVRYVAVAYFSGPPNLAVVLEASTEKIKK